MTFTSASRTGDYVHTIKPLRVKLCEWNRRTGLGYVNDHLKISLAVGRYFQLEV